MEIKRHTMCFMTVKNKAGESELWRTICNNTEKALEIASDTSKLKDVTIEKIEFEEMEFVSGSVFIGNKEENQWRALQKR